MGKHLACVTTHKSRVTQGGANTSNKQVRHPPTPLKGGVGVVKQCHLFPARWCNLSAKIKKDRAMQTKNEGQFEVEAECSVATPEQAISTTDQIGGNIAIFSSTLSRPITTAQARSGCL